MPKALAAPIASPEDNNDKEAGTPRITLGDDPSLFCAKWEAS
ncbi:MAG: hypothetical protein R3B47_19415 [Bacteroidia bacterium]